MEKIKKLQRINDIDLYVKLVVNNRIGKAYIDAENDTDHDIKNGWYVVQFVTLFKVRKHFRIVSKAGDFLALVKANLPAWEKCLFMLEKGKGHYITVSVPTCPLSSWNGDENAMKKVALWHYSRHETTMDVENAKQLLAATWTKLRKQWGRIRPEK